MQVQTQLTWLQVRIVHEQLVVVKMEKKGRFYLRKDKKERLSLKSYSRI